MKEAIPPPLLRASALVVLFAGASASFYWTLHAGRNNASLVLPALFIGWVCSPFAALLLADVTSKRGSVFTPVALYGLMLACSLGSLVGYSGGWHPPRAKPAGVFLLVPLLCWLLIALVAWWSRRRARRR